MTILGLFKDFSFFIFHFRKMAFPSAVFGFLLLLSGVQFRNNFRDNFGTIWDEFLHNFNDNSGTI